MSSGDAVESRLRRRVFLAGACVIGAPAIARAQVLIEDSPASGEGWMARQHDQLATGPRSAGQGEEGANGYRDAGARDWRDLLLQGERSIVMRRDGPSRRFRYRQADGAVDAAGYAAACFALRDVQANRMVAIDPALLDVLCGIQRWMEYNGRSAVIAITSGYRTQRTNSRTEGAVKDSMHLYGRAADIVMDGASSALVGAMVHQFNTNGGTGIYLGRGFVHVDTGAARTWVSTARRR